MHIFIQHALDADARSFDTDIIRSQDVKIALQVYTRSSEQ